MSVSVIVDDAGESACCNTRSFQVVVDLLFFHTRPVLDVWLHNTNECG